MAPVLAGTILHRDRAEQGWIEVEDARVARLGRGAPPAEPAATGWVVPAPVNAHTHVGDAFLRRRPGKPRTVGELVGPGGWKHRHLADADPAAQDDGIRSCTEEMAACGTSTFLDFREGGVEGVRLLRDLDLPVPPRILGRPARGGADEREVEAVLADADGVGLSGMRDMGSRDIEAWAEACHEAGKPFAVHVSEARRDDVDAVVALRPAFVVHMTQATPRDLDALAHARIPIVLCPRSNAWFGMQPPLAAMLEAGCTVALGTDNAMLQDGDIWKEAQAARALVPDAPVEEVLRMATHHGRTLAGLPDPLTRGAAADVVVLPEPPLAGPGPSRPGFTVPAEAGQ